MLSTVLCHFDSSVSSCLNAYCRNLLRQFLRPAHSCSDRYVALPIIRPLVRPGMSTSETPSLQAAVHGSFCGADYFAAADCRAECRIYSLNDQRYGPTRSIQSARHAIYRHYAGPGSSRGVSPTIRCKGGRRPCVHCQRSTSVVLVCSIWRYVDFQPLTVEHVDRAIQQLPDSSAERVSRRSCTIP